jgi:nitrate/nitrite-specific signal transduction histidine kinase
MKIRPVLTPEEERSRRTQKKRAQRRRQRERRDERISELESQLREAHWFVAEIRKRNIQAMNGDLTAFIEEIDRLCLSFQQTIPDPRSPSLSTAPGTDSRFGASVR